ncbi:MAG: SDR family oxidoreductase [Oscillospiraceae bacterium]|nr:SDR family oxidoreductase [Oscillospiraceae bacterium]
MDLGFNGKTVVITGGTKGIGGGISEVFAEEGGNLIINYRSDPEGSETFIQSLRDKYNVAAYGVQGDVSKPEDVLRIFDFAEEKFGQLDVLINNAGGGKTTMIWDITLEEWNDALRNNVTGMFMMSQEYAKRMIAKGRKGYIVNLLSKASLTTTTKGRACYVTNKAAEMGLTKQLAVDLVDKGIIVNGIMPGSVRNQMMSKWTEEEIAARVKRCPTGRLGEPYEFGKMVAFLASEQNQLSVGAPVDYTGGMMLGF